MNQLLTLVLLVACSSCLPRSHSFSPVTMTLSRSSCDAIHRPFRYTTAALLLSSSNDDNDAGSDPEEPLPVPLSTSTDPVVPAMSSPPPSPPKRRQLDGLMAAVTRAAPDSSATQNGRTTNLPFFGEMPVDGSLLVLAPAVVIAVVGFIMSIVVAYNAKDTFVDQLVQLSDDINTAALAKANQGTSLDDATCRGLCSSQEQQLEGMRAFMEGISTKK